MARPSRRQIREPGSSFHLVWRCHNRERLLERGDEKLRYLAAISNDLEAQGAKQSVEINTFAVMGNHSHQTATLSDEEDAVDGFSGHMRRAHSRFAQNFNQRHERMGSVVCGRPKSIRLQDDKASMRCAFYIDCNPVRAGLIKDPTASAWSRFSSCRFYAFGERLEQHRHLKPPAWYLALGPTPEARQAAYRRALDGYLVEAGLKRDPSVTAGHYYGEPEWKRRLMKERRERLALAARDPPDSSSPSGA